MKRLLRNAVLKAIRYYQQTGGSVKHFATSCNFSPSCSHYTYQAIDTFGLLQGVRLGISRIRRCIDPDCVAIVDDPVPLSLANIKNQKSL